MHLYRMAIAALALLMVHLSASTRSVAQEPSVTIISPTNNQKAALGKEVVLKAEGSDPNWSFANYFFYANGALIGQGNPVRWLPDRTGIFSITCQVNSQPEPPVISAPILLLVAKGPIVEAIEPASSTVVFAPASVDLEVSARAVGGRIRAVRFLDGPNELGVRTNAPYRIRAESLQYRRPITAVAEDDSGLTTEIVLPLTIVGMPGDEFIRPFQLSGTRAVETASNRDASDQSLLLASQGPPADFPKSIWWTWTAPESGTLMLSTEGSSFDTVMAILVRTNAANPTSFTRLMTSRNGFGIGSASRIKVQVRAGMEYRCVVGTVAGGYGGDIVLRLDLESVSGNVQPDNDLFTLRTPLKGAVPRLSFTTLGATIEPGEHSSITNVPGGRSVWWEWTTDTVGVATVTTRGSDFDTVMTVYKSTEPLIFSLLRPVVANDDDLDGGSHSTVRFLADPGVRYMIQVDGFWGTGGTGALEIHVDTNHFPSNPINDSIDRRIHITGNQLIHHGVTRGVREVPGAPSSMTKALWWGWTCPTNQPLFVTTAGSDLLTRLGIFWADDAGVLHVELTTSGPQANESNLFRADGSILAIAGREYIIGVAPLLAINIEGTIQLQLVPEPPLQGLPLSQYSLDVPRGIATLSLGVDTSRRAILLGSPDLIQWHIVGTNLFEPGSHYELPLGQDGMGFLKAYEWTRP